MSSLSKFPNEVLSSIFNNQAMPLRHRLRLRLLTNRCCAVIEDGLKTETAIVIRNIRDQKPPLKLDDLVIPSGNFSDELPHLLVRLFPAITRMTLVLDVESGDRQIWGRTVPSLLALLAPSLKSLKLYGACGEFPVRSLANALNALTGLTSLALYDWILCDGLVPKLAPVLSHLDAFACPSPDEGTEMASISHTISSSLSPNCTHLLLNSPVFASFEGPFIAQLSSSLTDLHLLYTAHNSWQSLNQMRKLSNLVLHFANCSDQFDSTLLRNLAPFQCLTDVKLFNLSFRTSLALPSKKCPPLLTIKRLTLQLYFFKYSVDFETFFQAIHVWFSSLDHLTLLIEPYFHPAISASLGKLPFSVEVLDTYSVDFREPAW